MKSNNISNNDFADIVQQMFKYLFKDFTTETKVDILGLVAQRGEFEVLMDGSEYIEAHYPIDRLRGASFHEWLLTNHDDMAFEIWSTINHRDKVANHQHQKNYANSAALALYANLPERLEGLTPEEWKGKVDVERLFRRKGIPFEFGDGFTETAKDNIQYYIDKKYHFSLTAAEIAALRGDIDLIKRAKDNGNSIEDIYIYYIMNGGGVEIEPFIEILKESFEKERYNHEISQLFKSAICYLEIDQLKIVWNELSPKGRLDFFYDLDNNSNVNSNVLEDALKKGRIKEVEYIYSLGDTFLHTKFIKNFSSKTIWDFVEEGFLKAVDFILKKNPQLLETREIIREKDKKMGTLLELAVIKGNKEMADMLLSHGANTGSLKEIIYCDSLIVEGQSGGSAAVAIAEKILLGEKLESTKTNDGEPHPKSIVDAL